MSPLLDLLLLCSLMSIATFLFGILPLALRLSRLTLRILEVGGAGLLLGAACSVVMPEGAGTLFRQQQQHQHDHDHDHGARDEHKHPGSLSKDPETLLAVSFLAGVLVMYIIDQIMAPGPHVHTHDPAPQDADSDHHHHGAHHPHRRFSAARHDPPTRDCPEERPFRRLTRPETLHLTRSSLNFDSRKEVFSNLRDADSKSILPVDATSALQDDSHTIRSVSGGHRSHSDSLRDHSPSSSQGSLPADYHTIPHDDGTQSFRSQSTVGRSDWKRAGASEDAGRTSQDPSPSSPLLHSPPRSPPRHQARLSQHDRRMSSSSSHSSSEKARGLRAAFTSVIGLVIHAACDGIAMGASSASHDEGLKLVVVAAIMIHKAPAAFGLCTLLLSQRLSRNDVRKAMAIFSLATPVGALFTYIVLNTLLNSATAATTLEQSVSPSQVGSALTFSAGSFIYVALHAVHELASPSSDYETDPNDDGHNHDHNSSRSITHTVVPKQTLGRFGRVVILCIGAVLPRGLQLIFGHGH